MQLFYNFYLQQESKTLDLEGEQWYVFDKSFMNEIKVFVKFKNPYILRKGHYFKAVNPIHGRFYIVDEGNVDFFEQGVFVGIQDQKVLSKYEKEDDAIDASELAFSGFEDPENKDFKSQDRITA